MEFCVVEQPLLESHQQRLEQIRPDGHATIQAPETRVHPVLAPGPIGKRELDFPSWFEGVRETRMRVPLGTVTEDLDQEVEAFSRMVRKQIYPRPPKGTSREEIMVQVFFDAEVKVNVDG